MKKHRLHSYRRLKRRKTLSLCDLKQKKLDRKMKEELISKNVRLQNYKSKDDPYGVTSRKMPPTNELTRKRYYCEYCKGRYEKHYVLKHMEICPMKTDPKEDIREMILRTMMNK